MCEIATWPIPAENEEWSGIGSGESLLKLPRRRGQVQSHAADGASRIQFGCRVRRLPRQPADSSDEKSFRMMQRSQSLWARYGVAVLSIVVAAFVRWVLSRMFPSVYPFAPIFLAIMFSAWYGGFGPSITASLLGLMVGIVTADSRTGNGHPILGLTLYAVTSLGIAAFGGAMAVARQRISRQIDELTRQHVELQRADHRKDEFLALLAHELRNPLAPIGNALQILKLADIDAPTAAEARDIAERQLRYLTRLVDDLLDVSRIMRGKVELRKERVELGTIIDRAVETARPLIVSENHQLTIDLPDEPMWLEADVVRMAQVLANLLSNAAKYTEPGGRIGLSAAIEPGQIVILVRDTGIGIAPEALPRLFEMFMQVAPGSSRSQGGLGIGLTLVKNLVEMHGGAVEVTSGGLGQGSEFVVRLPRVAARPLDKSAPDEPAEVATTSQRILVVDDNADAASSLAVLLRLRGHIVQVAMGGAEALAAVRAQRPELVFLDIGMPGMDGYEVARQLRAEFDSSLILIALTGWGTDQDRERSREAGFDYHLTKPVDLAALESMLTRQAVEAMSDLECRITNDQVPMTNDVLA
jgi:signal transduction histidine kinase/CheY-like chemotaxis protein